MTKLMLFLLIIEKMKCSFQYSFSEFHKKIFFQSSSVFFYFLIVRKGKPKSSIFMESKHTIFLYSHTKRYHIFSFKASYHPSSFRSNVTNLFKHHILTPRPQTIIATLRKPHTITVSYISSFKIMKCFTVVKKCQNF